MSEHLEDSELLSRVFLATEAALPVPVPKEAKDASKERPVPVAWDLFAVPKRSALCRAFSWGVTAPVP